MPDSAPTSAPVPFVADLAAVGKPAWLRFPLPAGAHRLRIRVTNTLGTHYEYGRPTSLVGANPAVTYWDRTHRTEWQAAFPSGGLYGPVRVALK